MRTETPPRHRLPATHRLPPQTSITCDAARAPAAAAACAVRCALCCSVLLGAGRCWSVPVGAGRCGSVRCQSVLVGAGRCGSVPLDASRCGAGQSGRCRPMPIGATVPLGAAVLLGAGGARRCAVLPQCAVSLCVALDTVGHSGRRLALCCVGAMPRQSVRCRSSRCLQGQQPALLCVDADALNSAGFC
jgi:hypothetical protein